MRSARVLICAMAIGLTANSALASEAQVALKTYPISGATGLQLYESIAQNGPKDGSHIAQTHFKLVWNRLFDERNGDCHLVHAKPKLSLSQTYPKPDGKQSNDMRRRWDKLMGIVRRHEDEHVRMIRDMVKTTETSLAGMYEPNDRTCAKVKKSVSARIDEAYQAHRDRSRAFDKSELGQGGPLFRALEDFVNER